MYRRKTKISIFIVSALVIVFLGLESTKLKAEETKKADETLSGKLSNKKQEKSNDWWDTLDIAIDPFDELLLIQNKINNLLNNNNFSEKYFNLNTDVRENKTGYTIEMDLPGMEKNDINIEIKNNCLLVSGDRKSNFKEENDNYIKKERSSGSFSEALQLPYDAKISKINATYKNGVLLIEIPKIINTNKNDNESLKIKIN